MNSVNFSKFFGRVNIIFLTAQGDRNLQGDQNGHEFFLNILEYSRIKSIFSPFFSHNVAAHGCASMINSSEDAQWNFTSYGTSLVGEGRRGLLRSCGQMVKIGYFSPIFNRGYQRMLPKHHSNSFILLIIIFKVNVGEFRRFRPRIIMKATQIVWKIVENVVGVS